MAKIMLRVNGKRREIQASTEEPLLWVLRDRLGLKGTKYGCGLGVCGSCTVHVDGSAERSCVTPVGDAAGRNVTTIEGIGEPERLHPLQQSWLDEDVSQCGYCQPGQIMTAAALLNGDSPPSEEQVESAMSEIVCRCGTYLRIRRAIARVAKRGAR